MKYFFYHLVQILRARFTLSITSFRQNLVQFRIKEQISNIFKYYSCFQNPMVSIVIVSFVKKILRIIKGYLYIYSSMSVLKFTRKKCILLIIAHILINYAEILDQWNTQQFTITLSYILKIKKSIKNLEIKRFYRIEKIKIGFINWKFMDSTLNSLFNIWILQFLIYSFVPDILDMDDHSESLAIDGKPKNGYIHMNQAQSWIGDHSLKLNGINC